MRLALANSMTLALERVTSEEIGATPYTNTIGLMLSRSAGAE